MFMASETAAPLKTQQTNMYCLWRCLLINLVGVASLMFLVSLSSTLFAATPPAQVTALTSQEKADAEIRIKLQFLENFVHGVERQVLSLATSDFTKRFAASYGESERNSLNTLFQAVAEANADYMQVRFLDAQGKERVRVDRPKGSMKVRVVTPEAMQGTLVS
jgi:hypothetical protein